MSQRLYTRNYYALYIGILHIETSIHAVVEYKTLSLLLELIKVNTSVTMCMRALINFYSNDNLFRNKIKFTYCLIKYDIDSHSIHF